MLRDLLKEGGLYTIANLLTKGVSLLLLPYYTAHFSTTDYGIIEILMVGGALLNAILTFQLYQGVGRFLPEPSIEAKEKIKIASTALLFVIFSFSIGSFLLLSFDDFFIDLLSSNTRISPLTFQLAIGSVAVSAVFYSLGIQLRSLRKVSIYTISTFCHAIFNIIGTIILVSYFDSGIDGIYIATLIVTPVIILVQLYHLRKNLSLFFGKSQFKKLLNFSFPLIPASMAYIILNFTDRIFVNEQLSPESLGIYGVSARFPAIISIVILGFSSALTPMVFNAHDKPETKIQLKKFFLGFFAIGTLGVLALSIFSLETLKIFTQASYYKAFELMPIFYLSMFITGLNMFSIGLHIKGRTRIVAFVVIFSALLNVLLNYLLIPEFELYGAAFATLIAVTVNNGLIFYFSNRSYPINLSFAPLLFLSPLLIGLIYIGNYYLIDLDLGLLVEVLIKILIIAVYLYALIKTKVLDPFWIKKIFYKK